MMVVKIMEGNRSKRKTFVKSNTCANKFNPCTTTDKYTIEFKENDGKKFRVNT